MSRSAFSFDQIDTNGDGAISRSEFAWGGRGSDISLHSRGRGSDIHEIEKMKSEHFVAQMTLSKEQVEIFSRDISFLRQAVAQLQEAMGKSTDGHSRGHAALVDRVAFLEKDVGDVKGAHEDHVRRMGYHANMEERMSFVEKTIGDSATKHEQHMRDLTDLRGTYEAHVLRMGHHANMEERLSFVENTIGDSANKHEQHVRDLADLRKMHDTHVGDFWQQHQSTKDRHEHHATFEQRIAYLEKGFGDSADTHARMLEEMKRAHDEHLRDFDAHRNEHASVPERIAYIEKAMGDSADKHNQMIAELMRGHEVLKSGHQKHDSLPERVAVIERTLQEKFLEMQKLHDKHAKSVSADKLKSELKEYIGAFEQRINFLGKEGATVTVLKDFVSNSLVDKVLLKAGQTGVVSRVDSDGDVLVNFREHPSMEWITRNNFDKLMVSKAEVALKADGPELTEVSNSWSLCAC